MRLIICVCRLRFLGACGVCRDKARRGTFGAEIEGDRAASPFCFLFHGLIILQAPDGLAGKRSDVIDGMIDVVRQHFQISSFRPATRMTSRLLASVYVLNGSQWTGSGVRLRRTRDYAHTGDEATVQCRRALERALETFTELDVRFL